VIAAMVVATHAQPAAAGTRAANRASRLDANLRVAADEGARSPQRVIITVRAGARAAVREALVAHGDRVLGEHESINAFTALVHGEDLGPLGDRADVVSVASDAVVRPSGLIGGLLGVVGAVVDGVVDVLLPNGADTSGPAVSPALLRATLGVGSTWTGNGVGVAVIDSGIEMSYEFQGRVTAFYDFTGGGTKARTPYDDYGHGTHIASTIGGSGALSWDRAYRGLAPKVDLIVLKVLDKNGSGWTSDVIRAVDFAVANRRALGIDVINLSLGHPIFEPAATDPLVQAVERAARAGMVVVAAAGNFGKNPETGLTGYGGVTSPGNAPSAITVGAERIEETAKRDDDRIADYSSAGPTWYDGFVKPDIVAPGHNIVAAAAKRGTLYNTYPQLKAEDGDYMRLSGTSMATAVTTGAIAELIEANRHANAYPRRPSLTPNAIKALLQYTSLSIRDAAGAEYDALRKGAGALNVKGAIDLGRTLDTSAPTGTAWLTTAPLSPHSRIDGTYYPWSQAIIWGSSIIWGSTFSINETAWSQAIIWGSNGLAWDDAIIWGSNLVWTDPQSWANAIVWGSDVIGQADGDAIIWGSTAGLSPETTAWKSLDDATMSGTVAQQ
jgi:serine protease AprX